MSFALVGLAASLGARYPRFSAENAAQVSGSYGGVTFMISAVFFVILMIVLIGWPSSVYLYYSVRPRPIPMARQLLMGALRPKPHLFATLRVAHLGTEVPRHLESSSQGASGKMNTSENDHGLSSVRNRMSWNTSPARGRRVAT
ncbi:MAG: hypothetical protein CL476_05570 [Acidobacteria bacterium]|jgi:hypothetical protein|nr:hypothetical protein [Acidobacteriota bacterium]